MTIAKSYCDKIYSLYEKIRKLETELGTIECSIKNEAKDSGGVFCLDTYEFCDGSILRWYYMGREVSWKKGLMK